MVSLSTEEKLHEAFLKLILKYPINKIKVNQVTEIAEVSRGSFYTHYESIDDLLGDIEFELLDAIPKTPEIDKALQSESVVYDLLVEKLAYIKTKLPIIQVLMSNNGDPHFMYQLNKYFLPDILEYAKFNQGLELDSLQVTLLNEAVNGSRMSVMQWWAYHSDDITIDQLAGFLVQYIQAVTNILKK